MGERRQATGADGVVGTRPFHAPGGVDRHHRVAEIEPIAGFGAVDIGHLMGRQVRLRPFRERADLRPFVIAAETVQEAMAMARALPGEGKMVLLLNDLTDNY